MTAAILLAVGALALLVLEVFLVSFGMLAIVAITCGVGSAVVAFGISTMFGWTMLGILIVGGPICVVGAFKVLPHIPFGRRLYLDPPRANSAKNELDRLLGRIGTAVTALRPAGTVLLDGEPVDVVSDGDLIQAGQSVKVVEVSGNRVRVQAHQPDQARQTDQTES